MNFFSTIPIGYPHNRMQVLSQAPKRKEGTWKDTGICCTALVGCGTNGPYQETLYWRQPAAFFPYIHTSQNKGIHDWAWNMLSIRSTICVKVLTCVRWATCGTNAAWYDDPLLPYYMTDIFLSVQINLPRKTEYENYEMLNYCKR